MNFFDSFFLIYVKCRWLVLVGYFAFLTTSVFLGPKLMDVVKAQVPATEHTPSWNALQQVL